MPINIEFSDCLPNSFRQFFIYKFVALYGNGFPECRRIWAAELPFKKEENEIRQIRPNDPNASHLLKVLITVPSVVESEIKDAFALTDQR